MSHFYIIDKNLDILSQIKEQSHVKQRIHEDITSKLYNLYIQEPLNILNKETDEKMKIRHAFMIESMKKQYPLKIDYVKRNIYQVELIVKDSLLQNPKCDKVLIRFLKMEYVIFIKLKN
jgi:hypothetical protein